MSATDEMVLEKARILAGACARTGVRDNQLGQVLTHLKRGRDLASTRRLVDALAVSTFATRTKSTRFQLQAIRDHVGEVLRWANNWEDAARVIGWAKRLCRWAGRDR